MKTFQWTVVGAGPAGIAAVGKLLDSGIPPVSIAWVDPAFKVGDLGERWRQVSSNTKVSLFIKYLNHCKAFRYGAKSDFNINNLHEDKTCLLNEIADPLQWVSDHLCEAVNPVKATLQSMQIENGVWNLKTESESFASKNVILAIGATPKKLNYPNLKEIPLEEALCAPPPLTGETVAVFGSSHSAMIVLQKLLETSAAKVINFYNSPLKFALYLDDWILFDNTGLKGETAVWVRKNVLGKMPSRLERVQLANPKFKHYLGQCQSVVYAIGFERRKAPETPQFEELICNESNGIIAPGLFGLGIAYPQKVEDRYGNIEHNVGLWKFMTYLDEVLPIWMQYVL